MANVILFHSAYGLRSLERRAAERLARAGHHVQTPDLYGGAVAESMREALALRDHIGWESLCERADSAVANLPSDSVLGGFSLGAGIAASLWPRRQHATGLLFLHGIFPMPDISRAGLPIQVHLAEPDAFESEEDIVAFTEGERLAGSAFEMFRYPGPGHLFTDEMLPDYDANAADKVWHRVERFLSGI